MAKLIMLMGLPGSGKTTWANAQVEESFTSDLVKHGSIVRVNKDDIRAELGEDGWVWSPANEKDVIGIRDRRIKTALQKGLNVISDDTNFARQHRVRLEELAKEAGAEFVVKKFDTPIEECIRRDALRTTKVGEKVIRDMAKLYNIAQDYSSLEPYVGNKALTRAVICDLDGTLCINKGRSYYDASTCAEDGLNGAVWDILDMLRITERAEVIYLSGREDKYRGPTELFLKKHECPQGALYMRTTGDNRNDAVIKLELFEKRIRHNYNILFVLEDRDRCVRLWRALGLQCFQVAEGAF